MIDLEDVQSVILRPSKAADVDIWFVTHASSTEMREFLEVAANAVTTVAQANEAAAAHKAVVAEAKVAGAEEPPPPGALAVGITGEGMRLCGIEERVFSALPATFTAGMRSAAKRLHDDPKRWEPPFLEGPAVHAVVLQYGAFPLGELEWYTNVEFHWHGKRNTDNTEPFGFKDNISDPVIEGSGKPMSAGAGVWDPVARQWRPVKAGEAVLGYVDESGGVAGNPDTAYLERNGSYFVIRKLEQDVGAFDTACSAWAGELGIGAEEVGAQLVGRHKDGRVLGQPPGETASNGFLFRKPRSPAVPSAPVAPVPPSAHIRRSNPRDSLEFADKIVPRHVLFRRGYRYRDEHPDGPATEGLLFMACCADIRRQFEFVQSHWLQDGNRFGLGTETDGIGGQRTSDYDDAENGNPIDNATLSIDLCGRRVRKDNMPSFVTTKGGDYFLLPSRSALRVLSTSRQPSRRKLNDPPVQSTPPVEVVPGKPWT